MKINSNEYKKATALLLNFSANLIILKSHYQKNYQQALQMASLNKPHTADKKELTEEDIKAILKQAEQDLKQAIRVASSILSDDLVYMVRKQGFFASIAVDMKKVITLEVPIAACNVLNAISHLYINPITYTRMEKKERIAVLIHEVLHLALFHVFRYLELPDNEKHHYFWNLACDCAINQLIPNNSEIALRKGAIFPSTFKKYGIEMPKELSAEEYYKILLENQDKLPKDMNGGMDGDSSDQQGDQGEQNGQGNSGDSEGQQGQGSGSGSEENEEKEQGEGQGKDKKEGEYKNWHKKWGETEGNKKVNEASVKNALRKSYTRHAGTLSANMRRAIEEMIESKIPWQQKFAQYTAKYLRYGFVTTFKRENRRLGELAKGRRQKRKLSVVVIADTSGSISEENYAQFNGQIIKIWKSGVKVTIMEADAEVTDIYEFKGKINRVNYAGGGGTSFIPPFEKIKKDGMEVDLVIYLTDGYGAAPDKCNIPTIWCLVPDGKKPTDSSNQPIKWGDVVQIN